MDPLSSPGVAVDVEGLIALRHLVAEASDSGIRATGLPGGFVTRRKGRGLETADIRVFAEGDDIRHIDRNATARSGVPHVRTFRDERDRTVLLLADFRPAMFWGTKRALRSVAAAEALALTGWRMSLAGARVGLMAFGGPSPVFVPARGRVRGMIAVIGGMASAHAASLEAAAEGAHTDAPLSDALDMAREIAPVGASVALASSFDDPGDGFDAAAISLIHRCDVTALLVRDAFETMPPKGVYPFETREGHRGIARIGGPEGEGLDPWTERLRNLGAEVRGVDASRDPTAQAGAGYGG